MRSYLIFNALKCRTTITDSVCSRGCIIRHFGYAFSRAPYPTVEPGRCCSEHPDPALGRDAFRVGVTILHHAALPWLHLWFLCPTCMVSGSLTSAPQSVSLTHPDHQTRLCNSVWLASPQLQGYPVYLHADQRCSCLSGRNCSPAGEGCDRAIPSSRYEVRVLQPVFHSTQERRWVTTNLGPASFELATSQTTIQNVDSEMHFRMQPSPKLVTYVTLVPLMEGSERSHPVSMAAVPPWGTGSWLGFSVKTWICIAPAAYLYSCRDEQQMDVIIACALAHLVYTRSRLVSWSKMPIHRSPPWRLGSLLQGMRVTYLTETFHGVSI